MNCQQKLLITFSAAAGIATLLAALLPLFGASDLVSTGPNGRDVDPLAWGLVFLLGGLSAFFGLLSVMRGASARDLQPDSQEQALDQVEKAITTIRILSKGVEAAARFKPALQLLLLESASSKAQDAATAIRQALTQASTLSSLEKSDAASKFQVSLDKLLREPTDRGIDRALQRAKAIPPLESVEAKRALSEAKASLQEAKVHRSAVDSLKQAAGVLQEQA